MKRLFKLIKRIIGTILLLVVGVLAISAYQSNVGRSYDTALAPTTVKVKQDYSALIKALNAEPKILDAAVNEAQIIALVYDDGTDRKGYAMYVCEVAREYGALKKTVRINEPFNHKTIGKFYCK